MQQMNIMVSGALMKSSRTANDALTSMRDSAVMKMIGNQFAKILALENKTVSRL
jgi:hypothetical protein